MRMLVRPPSATPSEAPGGPPPGSLTLFFAAMAAALLLFRRMAAGKGPNRPNPGGHAADFLPPPTQDVDRLDRSEPTAVFLVGGRNELGPLTLRSFADDYARLYRQVLFLSVGQLAAPGQEEGRLVAKRLSAAVRQSLDPYLSIARSLGLKADCQVSTAADPALQVARQADGILRAYPRAMFFVGKLVFGHARWYHRILHSGTADAIRESLERRGIPVTVLPVVLPEGEAAAADRN